ncbi:MAG: TerB family tellurite resistance protein [Spirochaetia bacterium]|nr:TerB family tellurite resistance protein [Spirochaetia bacterium]
MTHREAFILTCIELTRMDGELSVEEMNRCSGVLNSLGFSSLEFDNVENNLDQFSEEDLITTIKDMAPIMKKNLLLAMQDIAGSDGVDDSEIDFISTIREIIKQA